MSGSKKSGHVSSADDAWASLDESDDWRDRSVAESGGGERPQRTATNVRISPREGGAMRATNGPHLVVVAGAEVGRIYSLVGQRLRVGRGEHNEIQLSDASVSREHARLETREGGWWVVDLGSANGTFVQARRVQTSALVPGEQVAFGHVRLQFRQARLNPGDADPAAAPPAAGRRASAPAGRAPGARPRPDAGGQPAASAPARERGGAHGAPTPAAVPAAGAKVGEGPASAPASRDGRRARVSGRQAALVAVVLALGGGSFLLWRMHARAEATFAACQEAAKAFAAHDLDAAEQAVAKAAGILPKHPRVTAWRRALQDARSESEALGAIKEALEGGQLARARAGLKDLGDGALVAAREGLVGELDRAEKAALMEAQTALEAGLADEVDAIVERMGGAGEAARQDVAALARWNGLRVATAPLLAAAERWRAKPHPRPSLWERADGQTRALRAALATFRRARATGAARLALRALGHGASPQEQAFAAAMQRFDGLWDAGMEEYRGKRAFAAIRVLTEAKQLAGEVGGPNITPVRDLDAKLADMYYVVGMQALAAHKLPEAAEALRVAMGLNPHHALSARRLAELEERAQRMLERAEFILEGRGSRDKERARELLRQVVATMPQGTPAGARARGLLKRLG